MEADLRDRVLNPSLYQSLQDAYGHVRVQALGQACKRPEWQLNNLTGRTELKFDKRYSTGEFYRVKCPFCPKRDGRYVLYVHHMYGQTVDERSAIGLATCYRCHFEKDEFNRDCFREAVLLGLPVNGGKVREGEIKKYKLGPTTWPGKVCKLSELPENHPARRFIAFRGFDLKKLEKHYDIKFCVSVSNLEYGMASGRIVIPIKKRGKLIGWQARYPGAVPSGSAVPPYYTLPGFPTDQTIYNLDGMSKCKTGIVVEGVTDVWALGAWAGAIFGSMIHPPQLELLKRSFSDGSVVFLLDPDVKEHETKYTALVNAWRALKDSVAGGAAIVWLPPGKDPGNYAGHRKWLLDYIRKQAAAQGVEVTYGPR